MADGEITGWIRHEKLLMSVLERHESEIIRMREGLHNDLTAIRVEVAKLKMQASIMGASAGALVGFALSLVTKIL